MEENIFSTVNKLKKSFPEIEDQKKWINLEKFKRSFDDYLEKSNFRSKAKLVTKIAQVSIGENNIKNEKLLESEFRKLDRVLRGESNSITASLVNAIKEVTGIDVEHKDFSCVKLGFQNFLEYYYPVSKDKSNDYTEIIDFLKTKERKKLHETMRNELGGIFYVR